MYDQVGRLTPIEIELEAHEMTQSSPLALFGPCRACGCRGFRGKGSVRICETEGCGHEFNQHDA